MSDKKPFAFVLMPFAAEFDDIYRLGIQAAAEENGVIAQRIDEQFYSETMLERIYRQIDVADFIIADMTGQNANVFYEVGYAHAKGKLCTLLTQDAAFIPFDLKQHRHLIYGNSISTLKRKLVAEIGWLKTESEKKKIKSIEMLLKSAHADLEKKDSFAYANINVTFDFNNNTHFSSPDIGHVYLYTGDNWTFYQDGKRCPSTDSDIARFKKRHALSLNTTKLHPGAWFQIKVKGTKQVWSKYSGDEFKDEYPIKGYMNAVILTADGAIRERFHLDLKAEEFPF